MDRIWAPWRIKYVSQKKNNGCVFCKIQGSRKSKGDHVLFISDHCFAILNSYPYTNGHTMVVTKKHVKSLEALDDCELLDLNKSLIKVKKILTKIFKPAGFNIGANIGVDAGAGIKGHLHIHIVPRWRGDTNFMSVLSDVRVIPQSLKEVEAKFKAELKKKGYL